MTRAKFQPRLEKYTPLAQYAIGKSSFWNKNPSKGAIHLSKGPEQLEEACASGIMGSSPLSFSRSFLVHQARWPLANGQYVALPSQNASVDCSNVLLCPKAHLLKTHGLARRFRLYCPQKFLPSICITTIALTWFSFVSQNSSMGQCFYIPYSVSIHLKYTYHKPQTQLSHLCKAQQLLVLGVPFFLGEFGLVGLAIIKRGILWQRVQVQRMHCSIVHLCPCLPTYEHPTNKLKFNFLCPLVL